MFTADPSPCPLRGCEIAGKSSVSDRIIERQLTFRARGSLPPQHRAGFAASALRTGTVSVGDALAGATSWHVTVAEGKHQRVNFGVARRKRREWNGPATSTSSGARAAGVHARWSALDSRRGLDFNQPYFFAPHLSLAGDAQHWSTTPAYGSLVTGAKATLTHRQSARFSWSVSGASKRNESRPSTTIDLRRPDRARARPDDRETAGHARCAWLHMQTLDPGQPAQLHTRLSTRGARRRSRPPAGDSTSARCRWTPLPLAHPETRLIADRVQPAPSML